MKELSSGYYRLIPVIIGILAIFLVSFIVDKKQEELDRFFNQANANSSEQGDFSILFRGAESISKGIEKLRRWNNYIVLTLSVYCVFLAFLSGTQKGSGNPEGGGSEGSNAKYKDN